MSMSCFGSRAVDEASILARCREHLAAYKVPRSVQIVADVPKTSTGKLCGGVEDRIRRAENVTY
jgi:acyl-CoA synthetase (AMP-forming)/AMP-acid ligase II